MLCYGQLSHSFMAEGEVSKEPRKPRAKKAIIPGDPGESAKRTMFVREAKKEVKKSRAAAAEKGVAILGEKAVERKAVEVKTNTLDEQIAQLSAALSGEGLDAFTKSILEEQKKNLEAERAAERALLEAEPPALEHEVEKLDDAEHEKIMESLERRMMEAVRKEEALEDILDYLKEDLRQDRSKMDGLNRFGSFLEKNYLEPGTVEKSILTDYKNNPETLPFALREKARYAVIRMAEERAEAEVPPAIVDSRLRSQIKDGLKKRYETPEGLGQVIEGRLAKSGQEGVEPLFDLRSPEEAKFALRDAVFAKGAITPENAYSLLKSLMAREEAANAARGQGMKSESLTSDEELAFAYSSSGSRASGDAQAWKERFGKDSFEAMARVRQLENGGRAERLPDLQAVADVHDQFKMKESRVEAELSKDWSKEVSSEFARQIASVARARIEMLGSPREREAALGQVKSAADDLQSAQFSLNENEAQDASSVEKMWKIREELRSVKAKRELVPLKRISDGIQSAERSAWSGASAADTLTKKFVAWSAYALDERNIKSTLRQGEVQNPRIAAGEDRLLARVNAVKREKQEEMKRLIEAASADFKHGVDEATTPEIAAAKSETALLQTNLEKLDRELAAVTKKFKEQVSRENERAMAEDRAAKAEITRATQLIAATEQKIKDNAASWNPIGRADKDRLFREDLERAKQELAQAQEKESRLRVELENLTKLSRE
jgi:hypothetical protein